jgi:hypothetical protein
LPCANSAAMHFHRRMRGQGLMQQRYHNMGPNNCVPVHLWLYRLDSSGEIPQRFDAVG